MKNLENELKAAFALLDISNFKWLTDEEIGRLTASNEKRFIF